MLRKLGRYQFTLIGVLVTGLLVLLFIRYFDAKSDCEKRGGAYVTSGFGHACVERR